MIVPIQLHADGMSASANSVVAIDVPEDGEIVAVAAHLHDATITSGETIMIELSFLSTTQLLSNDARGTIHSLSLAVGPLNTNGQTNSFANSSMNFGGDGIPVNAGERIHLNSIIVGTLNSTVNYIIYFQFKGGKRASRRR